VDGGEEQRQAEVKKDVAEEWETQAAVRDRAEGKEQDFGEVGSRVHLDSKESSRKVIRTAG